MGKDEAPRTVVSLDLWDGDSIYKGPTWYF